MNDEGLAGAVAASPFRLPRLHPGIRFSPAVVSSLLVTAYHVLVTRRPTESSAPTITTAAIPNLTRRAVQTLEQQDYRVTLERVA